MIKMWLKYTGNKNMKKRRYHQCQSATVGFLLPSLHGSLWLWLIVWLLGSLVVNGSSSNSTETIINPKQEKEWLFCATGRHVHLSVGKDPSSSMIVSFSSLPCDLPQRKKWQRDHSKVHYEELTTTRGMIRYGTHPTQLNLTSSVSSSTAERYNSTVTFPHRSFVYHSEYYHHITLTNLTPDTLYYYECGTLLPQQQQQQQEDEKHDPPKEEEKNDNEKTIFSFRTAPEKVVTSESSSSSSSSLVVMGDVGVKVHSKEMFQVLSQPSLKKDLVLLLGDIAYADHDHRTWDTWMDEMVDAFDFLHHVPLQITAGNHDVEVNAEWGEIFRSYQTRFRMPHIQPPLFAKPVTTFDMNNGMNLPYDYGNSYYSFPWHGGLVQIIVLNSYAAFQPHSLQYTWLQNELSSINRTLTPWVMVALHCPPYTTFTFHVNDPQLLFAKKYLEPLFIKYKVNLVVSGHIHAYMRTHPIVDYEINNTAAPMYFIIGNGGRNVNAPYKDCHTPEPWVASRDHATYGYANFTFFNATTLHYQWVQTGYNSVGEGDEGYDFVPPNGSNPLIDELYILNQYHLSNQ